MSRGTKPAAARRRALLYEHILRLPAKPRTANLFFPICLVTPSVRLHIVLCVLRLKVLKEGQIQVDDNIQIIKKDKSNVTVKDIVHLCITRDRADNIETMIWAIKITALREGWKPLQHFIVYA
jgi:hypothetical protein